MKRKTVIVKGSNKYGTWSEFARVLGVNKKTGMLWAKFGGCDPNQTRLVNHSEVVAA